MAINAVFMLVSPRAWFRLPGWVAARGSLTKERYAARWGAVQIRITGAVMIGTILWVIYDMFLSGK